MRARLVALPACVRRILSSDANFLLAEFGAAGGARRRLRRRASDPGPEREPAAAGCLRLTVGTPEQNERLLAALEDA